MESFVGFIIIFVVALTSGLWLIVDQIRKDRHK
jgi:hypothetical protein